MNATPAQPPDLSAHLDAAERAGAAFCDALRAALSAVPEGDTYHHTAREIGQCIEGARLAGDLSAVRAALAEASRVKGPMVEVHSQLWHGGILTSRVELAEVTGVALIMRDGTRYGRRTGRQIGHCDPERDPPYITEAERSRVLALPRPAAAAKKAPK